MTDIPIAHAMLVWAPRDEELNPKERKRVQVVHHPDRYNAQGSLRCSSGACWAYWRDMSTKERKLKLLIDAWHIVLQAGLPPKDVHNALLVVPEYRETLALDFSINSAL